MIYHHTAYVVDDLDASIARWQHSLDVTVELPPTIVAAHGVSVAFLTVGGGRIELVQPLHENSAVGTHERGRGHPDHVCYLCPDFDARLAALKQSHGVLVRPPAPSEAFDGKRMCFVFFRGVGLIEWVEARLCTR
jgi:methylmalonyl-CoA/ethylmalonyl-CoA epimerase